MKFIDTHTHLFLKQFSGDIDSVIKNAIASGVSKMFLPNISSETTSSMIALCQKYPENCFPMMGLHLCDVKKESMEKELLHVEGMLGKEKFIAVGEIGLDLYWDKTTLDIQKEAFETQIKLAKKYQLPIVIHVRESFNEAIEIVEVPNRYLAGITEVALKDYIADKTNWRKMLKGGVEEVDLLALRDKAHKHFPEALKGSAVEDGKVQELVYQRNPLQ